MAKGDREPITMLCRECGRHQYHTSKNKRNDPDRMELRKYCPDCRSHQLYREKR